MSYNGANIHNLRQPAAELLRLAPANAILITAGDPDIYSLWYFHHVEKQRPDVVIVDDLLFAFDWYRQNLGKVYPFLHGLEEDDLPHFTMSNRSQRPVCRVNLATEPNESTLVCSQDEN